MNQRITSLIAVLLLSTMAGSTAAETPSIVERMGFAEFTPISKTAASRIRGRGFFIGGGLQGQAIRAAESIQYQNLSLRIDRATQLQKTLDFEINLSDYRHVLGPEFADIDLSSTNIRVRRVVNFSDTLSFSLNQTTLTGTNVLFGPAIRITGGVFP